MRSGSSTDHSIKEMFSETIVGYPFFWSQVVLDFNRFHVLRNQCIVCRLLFCRQIISTACKIKVILKVTIKH